MIRALLIILATLWATCAQAQLAGGLIFPGPGTPASIGATYVGPGDVNSGAFGFWGVRCYSSAYVGNLADITDSATGSTTGTRLQCSTGGVISADASATDCTFVTGNACSPIATTCAVACNVRELYDQSGANKCTTGTAPCPLIQATNANRPTYVLNCINSTLPCLQTVLASAQVLNSTVTIPTTAQPFSISMVAARTASFTTFQDMFGDSATVFEFGWTSTANQLRIQAGSNATFSNAACNDNTVRAFQAVVNTTTSAIVCGSTASGALSPGSGGFGAGAARNIDLFNAGAANPATATFAELGWWGTAWNSTQYSAMHANQVSYYGVP